jgi:HemK-related putative methylase
MLDLARRAPARSPLTDPLRPLAFPHLTRLVGKALTRWYALTGKHNYDDYRIERVHGVPLVVTPSVFNPKLPRTGAFLAEYIDSERFPPDSDVLDMGTGCGVGAIFAARHARRVVAVDINAAAVRCARSNALINGMEERIDARHGDLFVPVAGERFDVILFNPPFLEGGARNDRDRAWRSADVPQRFTEGLHRHLKPGGSAWVVLSTFGGAPRFFEEFRRNRLTIDVLVERRFVNERLMITRLRTGTAGCA